MGKAKGKNSKKKPVKVQFEESVEIVQAPHSFVIHRGLSCPYIMDLTKDFRQIMEPFTALNLKERKSNKIKDYVSLSGHFHVSHMCIFNKASTQLSFKIVRLPRGPTLTFKVHQFTLARDVVTSSRKQFVDDEIFKSAPLVIMNNFTGDGKHLKLMASTFQNMFPSINLATVNLATIRRCVLYSYNPITKLVEMRHYAVVVVPVGLSRGVKKVVLGKIPNLSKCDDISDYFTQGNCVSDSEFEDEEANQIILPQNLKRKGNLENNKSAVRLHEIGPRCTFELIKIEDGLLTGEVLFHETVVKTEEEVEAIRKLREKKRKLKEQRKKSQKENKQRNDEIKIAKNQKKPSKDPNKSTEEIPREPEIEPDNDAEYYKQEVGEEPDEELFKQSDHNSRKRVKLPKHMLAAKKRKVEAENNKKKALKKDKQIDKKKGKGGSRNKFNRSDDGDEDRRSFKKGGHKGGGKPSFKASLGKPKFKIGGKSKGSFKRKSRK